jgi:hypothetical protein
VEKAKDFDPQAAFKNAKTIELPDEGATEPVYAPEPKKEHYVHLADDKDYMKKIEIDTHEAAPAPLGKKPTVKKGVTKKTKKK